MPFPRIDPHSPNLDTQSPTSISNSTSNLIPPPPRRLSTVTPSNSAPHPRPPVSKSASTRSTPSHSQPSNPSPPSGRRSSVDQSPRRDSHSSLRTLTDNPTTSNLKSNFYDPPPAPPSKHHSHQPNNYGGAGSYHPQPSPLQHVVDQFLPSFGVGPTRTGAPSGHHEWGNKGGKKKGDGDDKVSGLSHSDWSIPQAKAILSTYATLATLLAGTTTTLLTYYRNPLEGEGAWGPVILGLTQAALILNIYAALLAVGLIAVSITLQTPATSGHGKDSSGLQVFNADAFQKQGDTIIEPRKLSPLTVCILDRLTLGVSWLISLAGAMELLGLFMYAAHFQSWEVGLSMGLGGIMCIVVTIVSVLAGWSVSKEDGKKQGGNYSTLGMSDEVKGVEIGMEERKPPRSIWAGNNQR